MTDTPNTPTDTDTTHAVPDPAVDALVADPTPDTLADDTAAPETDETDETAEDDATDAKAAREAQKYRRRAQAAEAERDKLAERLAVVQRGEAERIAAAHLADGADLWRDGADITTLLGDDGNVDIIKVLELAAATATAHPHWTRPRRSKPIARGGLTSGASSPANQGTASWQKVLSGNDRR